VRNYTYIYINLDAINILMNKNEVVKVKKSEAIPVTGRGGP
jgi:hypothetical protein